MFTIIHSTAPLSRCAWQPTHYNRPSQITAFLKIISSADNTEISAELESYIGELEAKQPNRPTHIISILMTIDAQYPAEIGHTLETYIATLEAKQNPISSDGDQPLVQDPGIPRVWSGQRAAQREQHR